MDGGEGGEDMEKYRGEDGEGKGDGKGKERKDREK